MVYYIGIREEKKSKALLVPSLFPEIMGRTNGGPKFATQPLNLMHSCIESLNTRISLFILPYIELPEVRVSKISAASVLVSKNFCDIPSESTKWKEGFSFFPRVIIILVLLPRKLINRFFRSSSFYSFAFH